MTFWQINLAFCSGETSNWCSFEKKREKSWRCFISVLKKSHLGAIKSTIRTFLPCQSWGTLMTFLLFCAQNFKSQSLGWKNALTPHLNDLDGRAFHNDSESGLNSKITKKHQYDFSPKHCRVSVNHVLLGKEWTCLKIFASLRDSVHSYLSSWMWQ